MTHAKDHITPFTDEILRLPDVIKVSGLSKPSIYRLMDAGKFPRPFKISTRARGWKRASIHNWMAELEETK